jgi:conjugal transfer/entry exclusion protein
MFIRSNYAEFLTLQAVERIEAIVTQIQEKQNQMAIQFDNLVREVSEMATVVDSAIVLIQNLRDELIQIQQQMVDPELLQPLVDSLDAKGTELAAAVASTPE